MTMYLILNSIFIVLVIVLLRIKLVRPSKKMLISLGLLLILTALFDSLIIGIGIVGYDTTKILGVYIGNAPIEDFFYALLAVIVVPFIWNNLTLKDQKNHAE